MNKSRIRPLAAAISLLLLVVSCTAPLAPAWKSSTTLSMQFGAIAQSSSDRAIAQGTGYLYIRTIGGPVGTSGPLYGPFTVTPGATFTTTEIPSGTFSQFGILYSSQQLETRSMVYGGATYTFTELMKLPDATFLAIVDSDAGGSAFASMLDGGAVSGLLKENVTITEGQENTLAVTLEPIVGSDSVIDMSVSTSKTITSDGTTLVKRFFELESVSKGIPSGQSISKLSCKISAAVASEIGIVALYDKSGKLLKSFDSTGSLAAGASKTYAVDYSASERYYLYVEYKSAKFTLSFDRVTSSGTSLSGNVTISFAGNSTFANHTLLIGVMDSVETPTQYSSGPQGNVIGYGLIALDSSGSGSGSLVNSSTKLPLSLTAGTTYYYSGFIDVNDNYKSLTELSSSTIDWIMPHSGDYATSSTVSFTAADPTALSLVPTDFSLCTSSVYFVAQTSVGTGSGMTPANACTLDYAVSQANSMPSVSTTIFAVGSLSPSSVLTVTSEVIVMALDPTTPPTLTLNGTKTVTVSGSGKLALAYLNIDASAYTGTTSVFSVGEGNELHFYVSSLKGNPSNTPALGGAISITGGMCTLIMSSIKDFSADSGGAVYVTNSATPTTGSFSMMASSITNCTASNYGGAIYALNSGYVMLMSAEVFSGNTAAATANDIHADPTIAAVYDPNGLIAGSAVIKTGTGTVTP